MRVVASSVQLQQGLGLDLSIIDENATVEDLVLAMQAASDDANLQKELRCFPEKQPNGTCFGCTYCCQRFGIYLSRIDVVRLAHAEEVTQEEFMAYCTSYEPWKLDRVRLANPDLYCLREDGQGCGKYDARPLVCRLYICCPHTAEAKALIGEVNRLAEEDLVNWRTGKMDESNPFSGKFTYEQIPLRDCLSPELWQLLFKPEHRFRPVA